MKYEVRENSIIKCLKFNYYLPAGTNDVDLFAEYFPEDSYFPFQIAVFPTVHWYSLDHKLHFIAN
jgi:hypothetical protein